MKFTHSHSSTPKDLNNSGFTLVELMVVVAILLIVTGAIIWVYVNMRRTTTAQDQIVEMQQNIRAGLDIMEREIRMAGYDPTGTFPPSNKITNATNNTIRFTSDLNSDKDITDTGEDLTYSLYIAADGIQKIGRNDNTGGLGNQAIAENIDAIEFYYTLTDGTQTTAPAQLEDIRAVQISILARAGRPDSDFFNNNIYTPASGNAAWDINGAAAGTGNPPNDNVRRRLLVTTIQCRNMGL